GKEYSIRGFYPDNQKVRPFRVVGLDEADKSEMGDEGKWGKIEIDLFSEKAPPQERRVTLRSVTQRATTLAELKSQIKRASLSRPLSRNIIAPGATTESVNIEQVGF